MRTCPREEWLIIIADACGEMEDREGRAIHMRGLLGHKDDRRYEKFCEGCVLTRHNRGFARVETGSWRGSTTNGAVGIVCKKIVSDE